MADTIKNAIGLFISADVAGAQEGGRQGDGGQNAERGGICHAGKITLHTSIDGKNKIVIHKIVFFSRNFKMMLERNHFNAFHVCSFLAPFSLNHPL